MVVATFHFHGAVNYFLPRKRRNKPFEHPIQRKASIKDMLESLGPPHTEVGLIVVDGMSVDFEHTVEGGTHVDIYDSCNAIDLPEKQLLRPPYQGKPRFVLDTHLGRLASYLRMMGFDTLYRNDYPDDELAYISNTENRILLTRDVGLLKRSLVIYGHYIREMKPKKRIIEVIRKYDLMEKATPFKHCLKCNGSLHQVDKALISDQLQYETANYYDVFYQCDACEQVYWKGSHYTKMQAFIENVMSEGTMM